MTDNSAKIRALVLAALMVFSVFAGTVALTGSAAAAANAGSSSITPNTVDEQTTNTHSITLNASGIDTTGTNSAVFEVSLPSALDLSSSAVTNVNVNNGNANYGGTYNVDSSTNNVTITLQDGSGSGAADDTVSVSFDLTNVVTPSVSSDVTANAVYRVDHNNDGNWETSATQFQTLTITDNPTNVLSATHYDNDTSSTADPIIEIAFSNSKDINSPSASDFTVNLADGSTGTISGVSEPQTGRIELSMDQVYNNVDNVTIDSSQVAGSDDVTIDVTFAPVTVGASNSVTNAGNTSAYIGSNIAVKAFSTDTTFDFNGEYTPVRGSGTGSQVFVINSDDLSEGLIEVDTQDDGSVNANIELSSLGLDVSADDVNDETNVTGTVEADDINRPVDVALLNSDDEVVMTDSVQLSSNGEADFDLGVHAVGNYTVVATDVNTGVEATTMVNVTEAAVGAVSFSQSSYSVDEGGVAEITLELSGGATEGTLVIGREANSGYNANITFTDENEDGEVTVLFDTYDAGTNNDFVSAAGDDSATLQPGSTTLSSAMLVQAGYDIAVRTTGGLNATQVFESGQSSFGALTVEPRSTEGMNLWTAPSGNHADILEQTLTEDSTIAVNDWVVHEVSASGLEGLVDGDLAAAINSGDLSVSVEQTAATTMPNRDPKTLNVSASGNAVQLVSDADNSSYYIAVNTETAVFDRGGNQMSAKAGESYTATFTITDDRLLRGGDNQSVNATFDVVTRTASLDSTPVSVAAAEGQNISGSASFAPGTEFTVTIRSTGDTSPNFYMNPTATVQADGTWTITTDFTDQSEGDTFAVNALGGTIAADGQVGAAATATPEPTATATPEPEDTATPEPTATATPEPEDTATPEPEDTATPEPDTTTTTTPGFGVAVALVALLAAALLAGRRE